MDLQLGRWALEGCNESFEVISPVWVAPGMFELVWPETSVPAAQKSRTDGGRLERLSAPSVPRKLSV